MSDYSQHNPERGKRIRKIRREKDWSQKELAEKINRTFSAISKFESGEPMGKDTLFRLSQVLGTSEAFLLSGNTKAFVDKRRDSLVGVKKDEDLGLYVKELEKERDDFKEKYYKAIEELNDLKSYLIERIQKK